MRERRTWFGALLSAWVLGVFVFGLGPAPAFADTWRGFVPPPAGMQINAHGAKNALSLNMAAPTKPQYLRQVVAYKSDRPAGTIVVDTGHNFLYLVMGQGRALRYGIGVARDGFEWSGTHNVTAKRKWPTWTPPKEMLQRQPGIPTFMEGGPDNPLGARALYIGNTLYRIHGTNDPATIGKKVSSGCIRLTNADVKDLYTRAKIGAKVVVF